MAIYAHLALQNHNILPGEFLQIPVRERAFIIASDLIISEQMKKGGETG